MRFLTMSCLYLLYFLYIVHDARDTSSTARTMDLKQDITIIKTEELLKRLSSQPFTHKTVVNNIPVWCLIDKFVVKQLLQ